LPVIGCQFSVDLGTDPLDARCCIKVLGTVVKQKIDSGASSTIFSWQLSVGSERLQLSCSDGFLTFSPQSVFRSIKEGFLAALGMTQGGARLK
jgi:hypothetical protein